MDKASATAGESPPAGCILAFRGASVHVGSAAMPSMYRYNNKEYRRDAIEAVIAEEDSHRSPCAVGGGCSSPISAGLGSEAGSSDVSSSEEVGQRCNVIPGGDRNTKHFFPRLCGIFSLDDMKHFILTSRLALTKKDLDEKKSGANADVWQLAVARYTDASFEVGG